MDWYHKLDDTINLSVLPCFYQINTNITHINTLNLTNLKHINLI